MVGAVRAGQDAAGDVLDKLEGWLNKVANAPEAKEFLVKQGAEPLPGTRAKTSEMLAASLKDWARIVERRQDHAAVEHPSHASAENPCGDGRLAYSTRARSGGIVLRRSALSGAFTVRGEEIDDVVRTCSSRAAAWLLSPRGVGARRRLQFAQTYPERPIKVTVGFPAGSGADILCRYIIDGMAKVSGATFVVENKPGAAGNIGSDAVAKSKPDGYTLLMGASSTQAGNPQIYKGLPWDPVRDFEPVATFARLAYTLTVASDNPAKTVADLTQQLKAKGGKATFGFGNTSSLAAASLYAHEAGITVTSVAYKSTPQALSDVAEGQTDFMFSEPVLAIGQEKLGKVRNLAVTAPQRMISLPNVPTMREVGPRQCDDVAVVGALRAGQDAAGHRRQTRTAGSTR